MKIRGYLATPGLTNVKVVLFDLDGQVADFTNSNWKSFAAVAGTDTLDANELGSGMYEVEIPATFRDQWVEAVFFIGSKTTLPKFFCGRPTIADVTLAEDSMIDWAASRGGGGDATRDPVTGVKTYRRRNGTVAFTEAVTSTTATRTNPA